MKKTISLSLAEFNHLIDALYGLKVTGEYWGNKEQFLKRHDKLYEMLIGERDELKKKIQK